MTMKHLFRSISLVCAAGALSGFVPACSSSSAVSGNAQKAAVSSEGPQGALLQPLPGGTVLSGKNWLLAGLRVSGTLYPLEPEHGSTAMLIFKQNGALSGSTGINTFMGTWKAGIQAKNGTIPFAITTNGITKVAATNDMAAEFEQNILTALASVKSVQTEKDTIRFLDGAGEVLLVYIFRGSSAF